jgi:hypothetical protein
MKSNQHDRAGFARNEEGALNMGPAFTILGIIIGAVVVLAVIAALLPTWLDSVADVVTNFTDPAATVGDATADSLLPIFGLLIAFGGLFAIVALVFVAFKRSRGGAQ